MNTNVQVPYIAVVSLLAGLVQAGGKWLERRRSSSYVHGPVNLNFKIIFKNILREMKALGKQLSIFGAS